MWRKIRVYHGTVVQNTKIWAPTKQDASREPGGCVHEGVLMAVESSDVSRKTKGNNVGQGLWSELYLVIQCESRIKMVAKSGACKMLYLESH